MSARGRHALGLIVGMATMAALPAPASGFISCTYNAATHTATGAVDLGFSGSAPNQIFATADGKIQTNVPGNFEQCGTATVTNTDTIILNDASGSELGNQSPTVDNDLAPGFTNEPGTSDEIEIVLNYGPGNDGVIMLPTLRPPPLPSNPGPFTMTLGTGGSGEGLANLNAAEADGIDADVTMNGVDFVTLFFNAVYGGAAGDTIRGDGSAGTGGNPFGGRMSVIGGPGDDLLTGGDGVDFIIGDDGNDTLDGLGGRDDLFADVGNDVVRGGAGKDTSLGGGDGDDLVKGGPGGDPVVSGGAGNDRVRGNQGKDRLGGNAGDDNLHGGPGNDRCGGGSGIDVFHSCEEATG